MKKTKKKSNKKIKKFPIVVSVVVIIILLTTTIYFLSPYNVTNDEYHTNNKLLGTDRLDAQTSLINIVKNYIDGSEDIKEYVNNNNVEKLTISDLRDNFSIDIYEFENSEYDCDIDNTSIKFKDGYDDQTILLACKAFMLD